MSSFLKMSRCLKDVLRYREDREEGSSDICCDGLKKAKHPNITLMWIRQNIRTQETWVLNGSQTDH